MRTTHTTSALLLLVLSQAVQGQQSGSVYNVTIVGQVLADSVPYPGTVQQGTGVVLDFPRPTAGKILRIDTITFQQIPNGSPLCGIYNDPNGIYMETTPSGANTPRLVHFPLDYTPVKVPGLANLAIVRATPGFYIEGTAGVFRVAALAACAGSYVEVTVSGAILEPEAVSRPGSRPSALRVYQVTVAESLLFAGLGGGKTYLSFPLPPAGKVLGVEAVWIRHQDGPINTQMQYCQAEIGVPGLKSATAKVGFPAPVSYPSGQEVRSATPFYVGADAGTFRIGCGDNALVGELTATVIGTLYDVAN